MDVSVKMFNLGHGECILLEEHEGKEILMIDFGYDSNSRNTLKYNKNNIELIQKLILSGEHRINLVITHLHCDHYNGILQLPSSYDKKYFNTVYIFERGYNDCTKYDRLLQKLKSISRDIIYAINDKKAQGVYSNLIMFGKMSFDVLWPPKDSTYSDDNQCIVFGNQHFLFLGDIPHTYLPKSKLNNEYLLVKINHHGHYTVKFSGEGYCPHPQCNDDSTSLYGTECFHKYIEKVCEKYCSNNKSARCISNDNNWVEGDFDCAFKCNNICQFQANPPKDICNIKCADYLYDECNLNCTNHECYNWLPYAKHFLISSSYSTKYYTSSRNMINRGLFVNIQEKFSSVIEQPKVYCTNPCNLNHKKCNYFRYYNQCAEVCVQSVDGNHTIDFVNL